MVRHSEPFVLSLSEAKLTRRVNDRSSLRLLRATKERTALRQAQGKRRKGKPSRGKAAS